MLSSQDAALVEEGAMEMENIGERAGWSSFKYYDVN